MSDRIVVEENVLSPEECQFTVALFDLYFNEKKMSRNYLSYYPIKNVDWEAAQWLWGAVERCRARVQAEFELPELYVESFFIAILPKGEFMVSHADNEKPVPGPIGSSGWGPNHTPQRDYTAVVYLNDNVTGGEIRFTFLKRDIPPKPGLMVAFPCHHGFVHEVLTVQSGTRYSIPIWFSVKKAKAMIP